MPSAKYAAAAFAVLTVMVATGIRAGNDVPDPAAKIDSGLGALPHYTQWKETWLHATPAEKVDSGLGALPHYTQWKETWLHATPAEKVDSGLGEMTDVSHITQVWLYALSAEKIDSGRGEIVAWGGAGREPS